MTVSAQVIVPSATTPAGHTYTMGMLLSLSLLGIALHWLVDLQKAEKQAIACPMSTYIKSTWVSSAISFIMCIVVILIRHELNNIPDFTNWEGAAMVAIGYMGDSLLPLVFGFAKSKGINLEQK